MNIDTGQIKREDQLTEAERNSGRWIQLPNGVRYLQSKPLSKSELKRETYMARVREKKREGINV